MLWRVHRGPQRCVEGCTKVHEGAQKCAEVHGGGGEKQGFYVK